MPSTAATLAEEVANPGAGTLYVYGALKRGMSPLGRGSRSSSRAGKKTSKERKRGGSPFPLNVMRWEDLLKQHEDPHTMPTTDSLLRQGIAEYTYVPQALGGVLGRGKFSTVYKVLGADGSYYALKHTPLYPHHPLISARLLREPTLLSELPSHPCLIGVEGWVRTEGHFYLIEQYASSHVPLSSLALPLQPSRAAYILDQLVSVMRDTLHTKGRVCHRDLKGENVLVDSDTGEILLLDLGLATRFSASEPKLTTCCGSPAFHSPEIVLALARPPGEVTYYGPELDIWCIALTLLSLLLQVRFPLGPKHTSVYVMRERVRDRLQELDELYPPHAPWRPPRRAHVPDNVDLEFEKKEWTRVRKGLRDFLEIDGRKRMDRFRSYELGDQIIQRVEDWEASREEKKFKSVSFVPAEPKYTLPIYLDEEDEAVSQAHGRSKHKARTDCLVLRNPSNESEKRVKSYIKYLLRSAGILYHLLPAPSSQSIPGTPTLSQPSPESQSDPTIFQLVIPMPEGPVEPHMAEVPHGWFPSIFSFHRKPPTPNSTPAHRSVSLPPVKRSDSPHPPAPGTAPSSPEKGATVKKSIRCYIKLEFVHPQPPASHQMPTPNLDIRRGSGATFTSYTDGWGGGFTPLHPVATNASAAGPTKGYAFPPASGVQASRSSSASRPVSARPTPRRSVSHAPPASQGSRGNLIRKPTMTSMTTPNSPLLAAVSNQDVGNVPLSPLSRQVSLPPSPTTSEPSALSRAPSRASSRSRQMSGQHHSHHSHRMQMDHSNGSGAKVIVHLSDPRAYAVIKAALDIKPIASPANSEINSPLSPLTIRRPSLANSLLPVGMSIPDRDGDGRHALGMGSVTARVSHEHAQAYGREDEVERGRPRSKEDASSVLLHLQKVKSRNSARGRNGSLSSSVNGNTAPIHHLSQGNGNGPSKDQKDQKEDEIVTPTEMAMPRALPLSLPLTAAVAHPSPVSLLKADPLIQSHVEVDAGHDADSAEGDDPHTEKETKGDRKRTERDGRIRPRSRTRKGRDGSKPRGLLEVIFGRHEVVPEVQLQAGSPSAAVLAGGIAGAGYGRAARARSVPPMAYMGINELVHSHHHF
ncbi:hypothetical protein IAU60_003284 [Kwoniella sp. DSM 27419]